MIGRADGVVAVTVPAVLSTLAAGLVDESRLARFAGERPAKGARSAAVLALLAVDPLGEGELGRVSIVVVERSLTLRNHAGQLAFPGGGVEPSDADLTATAIREAGEEIGLDPGSVVPLGLLPAVHVAVSGYDVTAVVGWWRCPHPLTALDPAEVAAVHVLDVATLVDPATRVQVAHPSGYTGPGFVLDRAPIDMDGSTNPSEPLLIWGLTAHLLDGLLDLAGWSRPWDRGRTAEIPTRYLTDRRPTGGTPDAH